MDYFNRFILPARLLEKPEIMSKFAEDKLLEAARTNPVHVSQRPRDDPFQYIPDTELELINKTFQLASLKFLAKARSSLDTPIFTLISNIFIQFSKCIISPAEVVVKVKYTLNSVLKLENITNTKPLIDSLLADFFEFLPKVIFEAFSEK